MPRCRIAVLFSACFLLLISATSWAQGPASGANVNMVSGTDWTTGDPFLQRQNEPSAAVSTRNPLHLLAGAMITARWICQDFWGLKSAATHGWAYLSHSMGDKRGKARCFQAIRWIARLQGWPLRYADSRRALIPRYARAPMVSFISAALCSIAGPMRRVPCF